MATKRISILCFLSSLLFAQFTFAQPGMSPVSKYEIKGNNIYYLQGYNRIIKDSILLKDVDPKSFEILPNERFLPFYAKDKNHVYYKGQAINNVDAKTFNILFAVEDRPNVYADSEHIFYQGKSFPEIDKKTLKKVGNLYVDKNNVYKSDLTILENADAKSFEVIGDNVSYKDVKKVYTSNLKIIEGADPASFKFLFYLSKYQNSDKGIGVDKTHVFYGTKVIQGADPQSIQRLKNTEECMIDKNYVYFQNDIIKGADPKKVAAIKDRTKADRFLDAYIANGTEVVNLVYGAIIPNSDASTFYHVSDFLYADKTNFYEFQNKSLEANPNNFFMIRWNLIFSKNRLYDNFSEIDKPIYSFAELSKATDRDVLDIELPVEDYGYTVMNNNLYYWIDAKQVLVQENTKLDNFRVLGAYLQSGNQIFYQGEVVKEADPASFEWIEQSKAKDKNHFYNEGKIVRKF
ncbi:DKNYY domain-containing protein [Soonwooa sp.]|uniref:DKNYY domain-containing protein n=1 Tax=Soonwooa sp. TaxID=1938592 RepID=UPI002624F4EC|nr:DKNYY domain-containing protein [Soonwooa sp.]